MKRTFMVVGLLVLIWSLPLSAGVKKGGAGKGMGMPHGSWWQNEEIVAQLSLSSEQQEQIKKISTESRKTSIQLRSETELLEIDLENLLDAKAFDSAAALKVVDKIEAVRAKLSRQRMEGLVRIRSVMSQEQYRKLKAMRGKGSDRRKKGRGDEQKGKRGQRPEGQTHRRISAGAPLGAFPLN